MIRYVLAALALKTFSMNASTRAIYRKVGNTVGSKSRRQVDDLQVRIERGNLLVQLARKYGAASPAASVLEIGTGWMHWYALYLRMFNDIKITAFDVWDNRQFPALKAGFEKLTPALQKLGAGPEVQQNLAIVNSATSFDDLYQKLGIEYIIRPDGSTAEFATESFDAIISMHVLEHVPRLNVADLAANMYRQLKPGGVAIHQIGIDDHLAHYDRSASPKQYITYSDRTWRLLFENDVQYFNRIQMSEWLKVFKQAGFVLQEHLEEKTAIDSLNVSERFAGFDKEDLACTILTVVLGKPPIRSAVISTQALGARTLS